MKYLTTENLVIGHKKDLCKIDELAIESGEILHIKGRNGSGKSTLLKTLLGEISKRSGNFKWQLRAKEISYLPQSGFLSTNFNFTLEEILELYEVPKDISSILSDELKNRLWINASGGEKQLTLILSRISQHTKLLILDEPLNHLDAESRKLIEELLLTLMHKSADFSILIVSHLEIDLELREFEL
ncbi:ATP-binding cassette domain-containing protein [Halobacteriovorax marinus]|uniref:ATP-binding cassette domain-containing protein n=1 Tax=Halobacteriovorax marinus TaxID=97084 RepID=UPI003A8D973D